MPDGSRSFPADGRFHRKHAIHARRILASFITVLSLLPILLGGCGGPYLMPTPNLYARGHKDPFPQVPPQLQSNKVEVLYLTDRQEEKESSPARCVYGSGRSRSVAFGVATMEI